jgi:hypothetical protein
MFFAALQKDEFAALSVIMEKLLDSRHRVIVRVSAEEQSQALLTRDGAASWR